MKKAIITGVILSISFSINAQNWFNNKRIKGDGKVITETRITSDYSAISVAGFFDVLLIKGKEGADLVTKSTFLSNIFSSSNSKVSNCQPIGFSNSTRISISLFLSKVLFEKEPNNPIFFTLYFL